MGRKFLVGGNWKCNGTLKSATQLAEAIANNSELDASKVDIVIAPATIHLVPVQQNTAIQQRKDIHVSAQNVYHQNGAFTGEISIDMVKDLGLKWVILGHSERRQIFGESDEFIATKAKHCLEKGLNIIACIGETLEERKSNRTMEVLERQMAAYAKNIPKVEHWDQFVIAYEPVWAIGTGVVATTEQAQEVNGNLRQWLRQNVSAEVADKVRILYGGSVKPNNSDELAKQPDIDGFLVGGASLVAKDFADIILSCQKLSTEKSKL